MNVEAAVLKLLLHENDKEKSLTYYSELRPEFFSSSFKSILAQVSRFYDVKGEVPNLNQLLVFRARDEAIESSLTALEMTNCEGVDIELAIDELANQYAQNLTLDLMSGVLEDVTLLSRHELVEKLTELPMTLESKIDSSNKVFSIKDVNIFKPKEDFEVNKISSGISNAWDQEAGGYYLQDLILLGGRRGSGKSLVCANLIKAQHEQGNPSIYFTIEMTYEQTYLRIIAMLADVPFGKLKQGTLDIDQARAVCIKMASMFEGGDAVFEKHFSENPAPNLLDFQEELKRTCREKDEARIIIIDDSELTVATIDTILSKYKNFYGDKLKVAAVDYLNQVLLTSSDDMYDWKPQVVVSKSLKNLARKHNMCMVSPYQMDSSGEARFSKGILDAADVAQLLIVDDKEDGTILFSTTKARSSSDSGEHRVGINWVTLRINPEPVSVEVLEEQIEKPGGFDL